MLKRRQLLPYMIEIRDTAAAALGYLDKIDVSAEVWLKADERDLVSKTLDVDATIDQVGSQATLFNALESFLAAYARLSLLLYPVSKSGFAMERRHALSQLLQLPDNSPLANRDFRDSWMHHDERIDMRLSHGLGVQGQRFARSGSITQSDLDIVLRLIEVDIRVIYFHDRGGQSQKADLRELRKAILDLQLSLKSAWSNQLPGMEDGGGS